MNMHSQDQSKGGEAARQRRSHKKSKQGCRNCKLRRVKCDETRPQCKKCTSFRISCNYDPNTADLQMSVDREIGGENKRKTALMPIQEHHSLTKSPDWSLPVIVSDGQSSFEVTSQTLDHVQKFQSRTILTIGTIGTSQTYQEQVSKLAFMHPYLMHIIHTLNSTHDRYLSACPSHTTKTEIHHWTRAASLFNRKLSSLSSSTSSTPLTTFSSSDRDALWATSALLGVVSFSLFDIDVSCLHDAWPLNPNATLEWLPMCEGKRVIWKMADPLAHNSVFQSMVGELKNMVYPGECIIDAVPPPFVNLYDLGDSSPSQEKNPYRTAVLALSSILPIEGSQQNTPKLFSFIMHLQPEFRALLEGRDPRALLLIAYWYAKICHSQWWVARRAFVECQATCLYLERLCEGEGSGEIGMTMDMRKAILDMLQWPRESCELAPMGTYWSNGFEQMPLATDRE